jgi:hypothetical protein
MAHLVRTTLSLWYVLAKLLIGGGSITTYKAQNGSYIPELELLPFVVGFGFPSIRLL